jgi:hypothetical protein
MAEYAFGYSPIRAIRYPIEHSSFDSSASLQFFGIPLQIICNFLKNVRQERNDVREARRFVRRAPMVRAGPGNLHMAIGGVSA